MDGILKEQQQRSNTKGCGGKTHKTDSQNSDKTASSGGEPYHLPFSLQAASPETFGYTLVDVLPIKTMITTIHVICPLLPPGYRLINYYCQLVGGGGKSNLYCLL
jgi:hypothetical protein